MKKRIEHAIKAHKIWVEKLSQAFEKHVLPDEFSHAGYDDMCEFGKWLYSLDDSVKSTSQYRRVKDLHYRFHQEAALSVGMAEVGEFAKARSLTNGEFSNTSEDLIKTMEAWQATL